jgi:integrase
MMTRKSGQPRDGIYQRNDRGGFWISWTNAQGRRRFRKTDAQNITQARQIRAAELLRVEQAKVLGFSPPAEENFEMVARRYLVHQRVRLSKASYLREKVSIDKHLSPFFPGRLAGIRRLDVQRYVTKRSNQVSAHTVQKELNTLKHLLGLAVEWEIIPFNPAYKVRAPKVPAGRVRYLQPTELKVLIEGSLEWLRPIVALAASTGMRRSEIVGLRWMDLDLFHDRIILPQTKNGEGRVVYLNRFAQSALGSLAFDQNTKPANLIFPGITAERVSIAFRRTVRRLGIANFRFHDLRHTAASWLRMSGADIHTVAQLLGHKDLRMAVRYQHLSSSFLTEAVGKLDSVFGTVRYQDVTAQNLLTEGEPVSC